MEAVKGFIKDVLTWLAWVLIALALGGFIGIVMVGAM